MRQWNVIATLAVILTVAYVGVYSYFAVTTTIDIQTFREGVLPVLTAILGYLARMLKAPT